MADSYIKSQMFNDSVGVGAGDGDVSGGVGSGGEYCRNEGIIF